MKTKLTLTKAELAQGLSELGISIRYAKKVIDYFLTTISQKLQQGEVIHLVGFGAFHYKIRNARKGRNPRTGVSVQVPVKRVIQFRPSVKLKKLVRDKRISGT